MSRPIRSLKDILERMQARSPRDELLEVEALARLLAEVAGIELPHDHPIHEGRSPAAKRYWLQAVAAHAFITGRDAEALLEPVQHPMPH